MTLPPSPSERLIVALDVKNRQDALGLIERLPGASIFKVGLELFTAEGPGLLREIGASGKKVFLDLKLHDIPNTVAQAVRAGAGLGVRMMTLHASGGREMMARAAEAAAQVSAKERIPRPLLLGVTVLTSLGDDDLGELGLSGNAQAHVLRLARLACQAGLDGIVSSAREIKAVRRETGKDALIVTPGIRPAWAASDDQKRIMTPAEAIRAGADFLVIGRPVIRAADPQEAFDKILEEIA
ncbi:MAG: orotidine-5'-phosphate decarboxylase [Candidatus Aminicenantes bacterium]|nr:orotidine-5'-phosphate decarboxylase [Candidatus Aminicenantes bacterium]